MTLDKLNQEVITYMENSSTKEYPTILILHPLAMEKLGQDVYSKHGNMLPLANVTNIRISVIGTTLTLYRSLDVEESEFKLAR